MALGAAGGSSIITQPVGSQTAPTVVQRALFAVKKTFFTSADLQDPDKLYQVIRQLDDALATALRSVSTSPIVNGNLLRGITFTMGQTLYLNHGLGRPYLGVIATQALGNPWSYTIATLPMSVTASQVLPITSTNAGTYDLWIFG